LAFCPQLEPDLNKIHEGTKKEIEKKNKNQCHMGLGAWSSPKMP